MKSRNRIEDIKNKRASKEKVKSSKNPPFNTQANREFDYTGSAIGPGPGTYIDITDPKYSSVLHKSHPYGNPQVALLKKANANSNFGSNIDRFENPEYKKSVETPGPGAYDKPTNYNDVG